MTVTSIVQIVITLITMSICVAAIKKLYYKIVRAHIIRSQTVYDTLR